MARSQSSSASRKQKLRAHVLVEARRKFEHLFGCACTDAWASGVREHIERLTEQDRAARAAAKYIDRSPRKAREVVRSQGLLDDPRVPLVPGTAPVMAILADVVRRRARGELVDWRLGEDVAGRDHPFASFRSSVIYFFEAVPAHSQRTLRPAACPVPNDIRVLTNAELVTVMCCLDVDRVTLTSADDEGDVQVVAREVRARERLLMMDARKRHGMVDMPRSKEEWKKERKKLIFLPHPHGDDPTSLEDPVT